MKPQEVHVFSAALPVLVVAAILSPPSWSSSPPASHSGPDCASVETSKQNLQVCHRHHPDFSRLATGICSISHYGFKRLSASKCYRSCRGLSKSSQNLFDFLCDNPIRRLKVVSKICKMLMSQPKIRLAFDFECEATLYFSTFILIMSWQTLVSIPSSSMSSSLTSV